MPFFKKIIINFETVMKDNHEIFLSKVNSK